jgi:hypothetical protein
LNQNPAIEALYDRYSPMLYGIALQVSPTQSEAEEILIRTFQKIGTLKLAQGNNRPIPCISLIKMTIEAAHELLGSFCNNIKLKQFESTPILHKLLCEQMSIDNYCEENGIDRANAAKMIRVEFASMRKLKVIEPYSAKINYG